MPFCPKCWKEYPKGFATCEACEVPLTNVPPAHKHEEKPKTEPKAKSPKKK